MEVATKVTFTVAQAMLKGEGSPCPDASLHDNGLPPSRYL